MAGASVTGAGVAGACVAGAPVAGAGVAGAGVAGNGVDGATVGGAAVAGLGVVGAVVGGACVAGDGVAGATVSGTFVGASVAGTGVVAAPAPQPPPTTGAGCPFTTPNTCGPPDDRQLQLHFVPRAYEKGPSTLASLHCWRSDTLSLVSQMAQYVTEPPERMSNLYPLPLVFSPPDTG